jgi:DNA/RNA-binding domain of Phe-tRNA-synthetase-like protein
VHALSRECLVIDDQGAHWETSLWRDAGISMITELPNPGELLNLNW